MGGCGKGRMASDYDPKWAEVERRIMALEERINDFATRVMTHEAVCNERQKSMFNVIAALDTRTVAVSAAMDKLSNRFIGWYTGLIGGLFAVCLGLISVIWSHR